MTEPGNQHLPHEGRDINWRLAQAAAILATTEDAIVSKSLEGIILSWNPAAERIFGYSAEEAIGSAISLIVPPDRAAEEASILARLCKGEKIERLETARIRKDGRRIQVCLSITPMLNRYGQIIGATKVARDITQTKTTQQQIRLEQERSRILLSSIGDAVIVTDVRGYVEFLNPVAEALTGWKQADAAGKPLESVFNIVNETSRRRVENPAVRAMQEGVAVGLANHTILISQNGAEFAIDDSAAPIKDDDGNVTGAILVFRDVSGARAVENIRAKLSAIVEGSDDAIVGKDLEGRIVSWNRGAERIFGYSQQEAVGRPVTILIPPDRLNEEAHILERLRRGERVEHFDTVRLAKDRRKVQVSVTVSPIFDAEGHVIGASKIARDISDRKNAERALAQAHEELRRHAAGLEKEVQERTADLRESLQEIETFSSSLSHDLKAPLRSIATYAQALTHDYAAQLPPEAQRQLERIAATCSRLGRLIDNVLSHARLRTGNVELRRVELDTLVPRILQEHGGGTLGTAALVIERPLLPVLAQEEFLTQALANLVSNGLKFVAPGTRPQLKIWTERVEDGVRLWVEDNGIGIREADQDKLFRLFTRVGRPGAYEGSGVGLAVVRLAVRRMGGDVGVVSQEGSGSRFWLRLRAADDPSLQAERRQTPGIISFDNAEPATP